MSDRPRAALTEVAVPDGRRAAQAVGCDVGQVVGSPCPVCDEPLAQEHAHTRCRACGWLGKCCE